MDEVVEDEDKEVEGVVEDEEGDSVDDESSSEDVDNDLRWQRLVATSGGDV